MTTSEIHDLLDEALPLMESVGDHYGLARAWHLRAAVLWSLQGKCGDGEGPALRALDAYRRAGYAGNPCMALLAGSAFHSPLQVPAAIERCEELLEEARHDPKSRRFVLPVLASLEAMRGDFERARAYLLEARDAQQRVADPSTLAMDWALHAATVELLADDPRRAAEISKDACATLRDVGDNAWLATHLGWLAEALYRQGFVEEAAVQALEAAAVAPADDVPSQIYWRRVRAKAIAQAGDSVDAIRLVTEAIELGESGDDVNEQGETLLDLSDVLLQAGKTMEAESAAEEARLRFEQKGNVVAAARACARLRFGEKHREP